MQQSTNRKLLWEERLDTQKKKRLNAGSGVIFSVASGSGSYDGILDSHAFQWDLSMGQGFAFPGAPSTSASLYFVGSAPKLATQLLQRQSWGPFPFQALSWQRIGEKHNEKQPLVNENSKCYCNQNTSYV